MPVDIHFYRVILMIFGYRANSKWASAPKVHEGSCAGDPEEPGQKDISGLVRRLKTMY